MNWSQMVDNVGKNLSGVASGKINGNDLLSAGRIAEKMAVEKGIANRMYAGIGIGTIGGIVIGSQVADNHPVVGGALGGVGGYTVGSIAGAIACARKL